ncbi:hypothetical protein LCGC14_2526800, partial [marine sediment metagenome]
DIPLTIKFYAEHMCEIGQWSTHKTAMFGLEQKDQDTYTILLKTREFAE